MGVSEKKKTFVAGKLLCRKGASCHIFYNFFFFYGGFIFNTLHIYRPITSEICYKKAFELLYHDLN